LDKFLDVTGVTDNLIYVLLCFTPERDSFPVGLILFALGCELVESRPDFFSTEFIVLE
jgi:hypothetical protein